MNDNPEKSSPPAPRQVVNLAEERAARSEQQRNAEAQPDVIFDAEQIEQINALTNEALFALIRRVKESLYDDPASVAFIISKIVVNLADATEHRLRSEDLRPEWPDVDVAKIFRERLSHERYVDDQVAAQDDGERHVAPKSEPKPPREGATAPLSSRAAPRKKNEPKPSPRPPFMDPRDAPALLLVQKKVPAQLRKWWPKIGVTPWAAGWPVAANTWWKGEDEWCAFIDGDIVRRPDGGGCNFTALSAIDKFFEERPGVREADVHLVTDDEPARRMVLRVLNPEQQGGSK